MYTSEKIEPSNSRSILGNKCRIINLQKKHSKAFLFWKDYTVIFYRKDIILSIANK